MHYIKKQKNIYLFLNVKLGPANFILCVVKERKNSIMMLALKKKYMFMLLF